MTYDEKVAYLSRYREVVELCADLQEEIILLEHKRIRYGGSFPKMPDGTSSNSKSAIEELTVRIDELELELEEMAKEFTLTRDKISKSIQRIPNLTEQRLLRYRYLQGYTFNEIATKMKYADKSYIHNLHKKIIKKYDFD